MLWESAVANAGLAKKIAILGIASSGTLRGYIGNYKMKIYSKQKSIGELPKNK